MRWAALVASHASARDTNQRVVVVVVVFIAGGGEIPSDPIRFDSIGFGSIRSDSIRSDSMRMLPQRRSVRAIRVSPSCTPRVLVSFFLVCVVCFCAIFEESDVRDDDIDDYFRTSSSASNPAASSFFAGDRRSFSLRVE